MLILSKHKQKRLLLKVWDNNFAETVQVLISFYHHLINIFLNFPYYFNIKLKS